MTTPADRPIPILLYHSLSAEASDSYRPFAVPPEQFRAHMERIAGAGYRTLSVGELGAMLDDPAAVIPARSVVLTFDDGFEEIHRIALPILEALGMRASVFVVTGYVGGTSRWLARDGEGERPLMDWSQISELAAHGLEVGSHSHGHRQLDTLRTGVARDELVRSRELIEDHLGRPVGSLAYPHGYHSATVKRLAREAGYRVALGVKHAISHPDDDRFGLGRVVVGPDTTDATLDAWLAGDLLPRSWTRERAKTRVWRLYRRTRAVVQPTAPAPDAGCDPRGPTAGASALR